MSSHTTARARFTAWLERANLTHAEAASQLGVTRAQVSHVALGTRTPSLSLAARIQQVAGIAATAWVEESKAS